jgi:DNA-binding CsgD family transcriptional regulator
VLNPSDILDIAQRARSFVDYEHEVLSRMRAGLRSDVAFVVRADGPGAGAFGLRTDVLRACRKRWRVYGHELTPVFDAAREGYGVALDADVLGASFRSTHVFREFIAPHGGRSTLVAPLTFGDDTLGTIVFGRCRSELDFVARELDHLAALLPALSLCDAAMRQKGVVSGTLTPREREIVRCLRLGYTNAQIGTALGTSVNTVRNQLRSVFRKLGATTRAEAVALSFGHGT